MSKLLDFLVENEPGFRKARLPALYSDFQSQRTLNPDGFQANVSAWRRALSRIVSSGLAPSPRGAAPSLLVLNANEQLLRELETKQYGRPLALGVVVREALAAKDLIPLQEFLTAKESIYYKPWSLWGVAAWAARQTGITEYLRSDKLPSGQFVVVANVEELAKTFSNLAIDTHSSRLERTFSKAHFYKTFSTQLTDRPLSETDADVLLRFLSRDKSVILYDGATIKIKPPGDASEPPVLTHEDASIAQLKELLAYLTHQTSILSKRVDELTLAAKEAVTKKNRVAALAALKSKKLAEATLAQRFATAGQLEEVAAKIQQAADNVALVRVMESSGEALASLHKQVGGAERVEEVVDKLREQMDAADEVNSILAEATASGAVVDEGEIDEELEAMEAEERRKVEEAERKKREAAEEAERKIKEAEMAREAEEARKRLEAAGEVPTQERQQEKADKETAEAEALMSGLSLEEKVAEPQAAV